jgi:hypothetical protein
LIINLRKPRIDDFLVVSVCTPSTQAGIVILYIPRKRYIRTRAIWDERTGNDAIQSEGSNKLLSSQLLALLLEFLRIL